MKTFDKPDKKTWTYYKKYIGVDIVLWGEGQKDTPNCNGVYNIYVCIPERVCPPGVFAKLWLTEELKSAEYFPWVYTPYQDLEILQDVEFPGGCTYYKATGTTPGFRTIQLGCDFNHDWDHKNPPSFDSVVLQADKLVDQVLRYLK